ncbi:MAG TPA: GNAT family N-acetyltransferase [Clostridia bacterium]|nr:GNAT family N-acetyltransferase [Clostridia bacterium]
MQPAGTAEGGPFEVRELDPAWARVAMGAEEDLVAQRLRRGSRCFGTWAGHELVGYGWLSAKSEWIGEIELEITPAAGEAYVWNCVTLAPHRRKGAFRSLVRSLVTQAREEGMSRLWIASVSDLGEKAVAQAGFVPVIRFDRTTRWGLRWTTIALVAGVDPDLVRAALAVMAVKPGSSLRRSQPRVH